MEKYIFENGLELLYEYRPGKLSSICIGFNVGALEEGEYFSKGIAHALEHVISKGTENRDENDINMQLDSIFGFENAMTNYPYTIYYGTCFSEDLYRGIELYSDIILNSSFKERGFKEEMNIIFQELKEWKDDSYQHCEDLLFKNSFKLRRIRETIIGNDQSIKNITLDEIKRFYHKFYVPENCVICVCSSLEFNYVCDLVGRYFGHWKRSYKKTLKETGGDLKVLYEKNKEGIFVENVKGIKGVKIQYIFDIHNLNFEENRVLPLLNTVLGQGGGSLLFNEIRTHKGLAYEVGSSIKNERGIKLFSIKIGTCIENIDKVISTVDSVIEKFKHSPLDFKNEEIKFKIKNMKLKYEIKREKSIEFCKESVIRELINDNYFLQEDTYKIEAWHINQVAGKFMKQPSIQILRG